MTAAKPAPAVNQVWRCQRPQNIGGAYEFVIGRVEHGRVFPVVTDEPFDNIGSDILMYNRCWSCVGIETPAGRVMVGERRLYGAREMIVTRISNGRHITAEQFGVPASDREYVASGVAQWPLLPPLPQGPLTSDTVPRLAREQQRRNVSAILADDARRHPAFALARRCAVLSVYEGEPSLPPDELLPARHAENILRDCHRYEMKRGGMTKPSEEARYWARHAGGTFAVALAEYERNRGAK